MSENYEPGTHPGRGVPFDILRAPCKGHLRLFTGPADPDGEGTWGREVREAKAKAICHECEFEQKCLEFALETHQSCGIWGGKTYQERRRINKGRSASVR